MNKEHPTTELLIDYLYHELTPEQDAAVLAHFSICEDCAARYEAEARLSEALRKHAKEEERELPPSVIAGIRERIAAQSQPVWSEWLSALMRPVVGLPVAAALVLAVVLGFTTLIPHSTAPSIGAAYYLDDHAALASTSTPFAEGAVVPSTL